jgi:hypothetical protein
MWKSFSRNRKKIVRLVIFFLILQICYISNTQIFETFRFFEQKIKRSFLHDFFQTSKISTTIPTTNELIVFFHIPRTSGDAMRTHLFNDANYTLEVGDIWNPPVRMPRNLNFSMIKLVKGHINKEDLDFLESKRNLKTFTFLRHPYERTLSFIDMHRRAGYKGTIMEVLEQIPWHENYISNGMVRQYGNDLFNKTVNDEILENAKKTLEKMDFVGFYENLQNDFPRLRKEIFPNVQIRWIYPFTYLLGAYIAYPWTRVLKFSSVMTEEEKKLVTAYNEYDLHLYNWALKKFSPKLHLYQSFKEFFAFFLIPLMLVLLFAFFLIRKFLKHKKVPEISKHLV